VAPPPEVIRPAWEHERPLQAAFEKIALLRYKYKGVMSILVKEGLKFDQKEGSQTTTHTYQAPAFAVGATEKETAYYSRPGDFHYHHCFRDYGGGVVC
jgi:hypothetical protein